MAQGLDVVVPWDESKVAGEAAATNKSRVMGSRRIFPPQFKLLVLDSYRNDLDCRGNQRATARKYNIHRRQIQKWLQCEQHLRSSVQDGDRKVDKKCDKERVYVDSGAVVTLNRSAMMPSRLGDAHPVAQTKVMQARNLKLVAQKLYPRSDYKLQVPLNLNSNAHTEPGGPQPVPTECHFNETPNKISVNTPEYLPTVKVNMNGQDLSKATLLKENAEGLKLCAEPESLVQKYISSEGPKFSGTGGLLCAQDVDSESSCLDSVAEPPSLSPASSSCSSADEADAPEPLPSLGGKSFSPKRKWMQESLQAMPRCESLTVLPIKQRVKLNLRSAPVSPAPPPPHKSCFSIERLCTPSVKQETPSPPACDYIPTPSVSYSPLPFPPPLVLQHRAIPDLVTLHFKPEIMESHLKEESMSDSDDGSEVDVLTTSPIEKKCFDLSSYHNGKRRSFSVQFKLSVLDAFYSDQDCNKNQRATARKFNINRRQVQKWLSQEIELRNEGSTKGGKYLQRQRLGSEPKDDIECTQCPQHCTKRRRLDKTIQVSVQPCSNDQCLAGDCDSRIPLTSGLGTVHIYDNYLVPEPSRLPSYQQPIMGWPNVNTSALAVPTMGLHYMSWCDVNNCPDKTTLYQSNLQYLSKQQLKAKYV